MTRQEFEQFAETEYQKSVYYALKVTHDMPLAEDVTNSAWVSISKEAIYSKLRSQTAPSYLHRAIENGFISDIRAERKFHVKPLSYEEYGQENPHLADSRLDVSPENLRVSLDLSKEIWDSIETVAKIYLFKGQMKALECMRAELTDEEGALLIGCNRGSYRRRRKAVISYLSQSQRLKKLYAHN